MDNLKIFQNSEFGELEILIIDGKEYFPAIECAKILGYKNPHDAIKKHCDLDNLVKRESISKYTDQYGKDITRTYQKNI